jgi:hypothetical protein
VAHSNNEFVYPFFKCLTQERLQYAGGRYESQRPNAKDIVMGGWKLQCR